MERQRHRHRKLAAAASAPALCSHSSVVMKAWLCGDDAWLCGDEGWRLARARDASSDERGVALSCMHARARATAQPAVRKERREWAGSEVASEECRTRAPAEQPLHDAVEHSHVLLNPHLLTSTP